MYAKDSYLRVASHRVLTPSKGCICGTFTPNNPCYYQVPVRLSNNELSYGNASASRSSILFIMVVVICITILGVLGVLGFGESRGGNTLRREIDDICGSTEPWYLSYQMGISVSR